MPASDNKFVQVIDKGFAGLFFNFSFLFWTETGNITGIGKANMDGTSNIYIVTTAVGSPTGLTVDASGNDTNALDITLFTNKLKPLLYNTSIIIP